MIKAVFFDVDGTLLSFKTHVMPDSTRMVLNELKKKGVKVFVSTGRAPKSFKNVKDIIDFDFDGYIYSNGQYVMIDDKVIHDMPLPLEDLRKLVTYIEDKKIACSVSELEYTYNNLVNERVDMLGQWVGKTIPKRTIDSFERIEKFKTYQISPYILEEEEEEFFALSPNLKGVRWNPYFLDVIPKDGGKAVGIEKVLSYFGLDKNQAMAFGDGGNDAEMLSYVKYGIAMGNATEQAKQAAFAVTDSVDEDGIMNALRKYEVI